MAKLWNGRVSHREWTTTLAALSRGCFPFFLSFQPPSGAPSSGLDLSSRLAKTVLTVKVGQGLVRQYRLTNLSKDGETRYFRCSKCDSLHKKSKTGVLPKIRVRQGEIVGETTPQHHADCLPSKETDATVKQIDRNCRKTVREGAASPMEAWEKVSPSSLSVLVEAVPFSIGT